MQYVSLVGRLTEPASNKLIVTIHLIPYRRLSFNTRLSVEQTVALLRESVEPAPSIYLGWGPKTSKPFEGTVSATGFSISRVIRYRNSFLPMLSGRLTQIPSGTTIDVRMTLHLLIWAFLVLILVSLVPFLISVLASQFDLGLSLVLLGIYLVMMIAFNFEANRAEALLKQILGPYLG